MIFLSSPPTYYLFKQCMIFTVIYISILELQFWLNAKKIWGGLFVFVPVMIFLFLVYWNENISTTLKNFMDNWVRALTFLAPFFIGYITQIIIMLFIKIKNRGHTNGSV